MAKNDIELITSICKDIFSVRNLNLDKIVLFGSYAKGIQQEDSDIDLILVSHDFRDKDFYERIEMMLGVNHEIIKKIRKPVDTLYYSDYEWINEDSFLLNSARKEGKVIFPS